MESGNSAELLGKAGDTPHTPPKIDIEHENSEFGSDDFPFPGVYSQVSAVNLPDHNLHGFCSAWALLLDVFYSKWVEW